MVFKRWASHCFAINSGNEHGIPTNPDKPFLHLALPFGVPEITLTPADFFPE